MMLTQSQWNRAVSHITRTCSKSLIKPLQTKHQRVERHFSMDYTDCQGSKDLGSPPAFKWVSLDIYMDLDNIGDSKVIIDDLLDVTPLLELENGETLSDTEALAGLGAFSPVVSAEQKKKIRSEQTRLRTARPSGVSYVRNQSERRAGKGAI